MVLFIMSWSWSIIILHCFIYYVCGETNYTAAKITNGRLSEMQDRNTFVVSLRIKDIHYCGGGIINEFHIITAAQCCFKKKKSWFSDKISARSILAVAGDMKLHTQLSSHQERKISCVLPHEKFDKKTLANDIALMRVKPSWTFNDGVKPVALFASPRPESPGKCYPPGWGSTTEDVDAEPSEQLRWYWADQCSQKECISTFGTDVKPGMFCGGVISRKQGPTYGDRGNPLVCHPDDALIGVATSTSGFKGRALFTGTVFHSQWIDKAKKRRCPLEWWIIVTIVVLLVLLASILICCLLKYFGGKKEEEEEEGEEEGEGEEGGEEED